MSVARITDHTPAAIARLMQQYKDKTNMDAIITALVDEVQDLEDAIFSILAGRLLWDGSGTPAVGEQLDMLGEIIGLKRNGLSDEEYILFLFATIAENNSDGTIPILINIAAFLFNPTRVAILEFRKAELSFEIYGPTVDTALYNLIFTILKLSVSGGIEIGYIATADATNAFRFDSILTPVLPIPSGFSTVVGRVFAVQHLNCPVLPVSGTFVLNFNGYATTPLAYNAIGLDISNALNVIPGLEWVLCNGQINLSGGVNVSFYILAQGPVALLTVTNNTMGVALDVVTTTDGVAGTPDETIGGKFATAIFEE